MKIVVFWYEFHWHLSLWVQLTIIQHWSRWWQVIIWTNDGLVYWYIYGSFGLNGLTLRQDQNDHHSADNSLKCIFLIGSICILINSLVPVPVGCNFTISNFHTHTMDRYLEHFLWNCCPHQNVTRSHWRLVNNGSSNGLVPCGNKPLSEPMLTQVYVFHGITRPQLLISL